MSHVTHTNRAHSAGLAKGLLLPKVGWIHDCGVATISRLLKIIGLFCKISSLLKGSFAKETCHFKEPTNRGHPIARVEQSTFMVLHKGSVCI